MDILIKKARIAEGAELRDIAIDNGKIVGIEANIEAEAGRVIEANGKVLIPGLVESHLHLDKALIADRLPNKSGTLQEAIRVTGQLKPTFTKQDIRDRASRTLDMLVKNGTTHLRTHSEFDPSQGFTGLEVILELREEYKNLIDIQVVAFPQEGIFKAPGTDKMMYEAMEMGCDIVGGVPYNDISAKEHIDFVFELAKKYNKPIDLHQDFKDDAEGTTIDYVAEKTIAEGFVGRVSVGHLTSIAAMPREQLLPIIEKMNEAQISVMSLPCTDLHLGARNDAYNVRRTVTPIRALRDGGVNMCIATNNIRNAFTPYGNGDLMLTAMIAIPVGHLGGADDLHTVLPMITTNPAKALDLKGYGIAVGNNADLVLLDSESVTNAIIDVPTRLFVIKSGKVTVETVRTVKVNA
ncbi:amidohydrolase family protein [Paenibacillus motobuensis]|uniref:N-acyl-D-amino-acid deacylase n=1 Tax=Paenibacillus lutimineralis TaxID=2707005 RepID=A0A3S9USA0_9BACL|nr:MULTISPECIES: amidohydrolase family protein [Paenibacillus]AZS13151.1 N-acyl-D-amino-acid deacylase [Paenibacillus lutimineralis]MCM3043117.1 amidohydrolase family protein [Paenibacillus lutimineralis]MCM3650221.1 amidohydrolase family protein [Paenibacillus motobuensis]